MQSSPFLGVAVAFALAATPTPSFAAWIFIPDAALANQGTKITVQTPAGKVKVKGKQLAPAGVPPVGGFPPMMISPAAAAAGGAAPAVGAGGVPLPAGAIPINTANATALGVTAPVFPAPGAVGAAANPPGTPINQFTPLTWLQNIDPVVSAKLFAAGFGLVLASAGVARSIGLLFSMFKH